MTAKEYADSLSFEELQLFAEQLQTWLGEYTQAVYEGVAKQMDDIVNNPHALELIKQLHERTLKEREEEAGIIRTLLQYGDVYTLHLHCLTHAKAYREVLYDMYIKDI